MRLPLLESPTRPNLETGPRSIGAVKVLRVSVTDKCNFRCVYCMPADGVKWLPQADVLSFEEISAVVRAAVEEHGIRRFKLTGGEPTVRHGLVDLIALLRRIPGVEELSLTTNGALLERLARPMRQAGLDRITISVDSLRPDRFKQITRTGDLATVQRGIDATIDAGFESTKINCVTMRGTNDDELVDFAKLTITGPLTVRFIEYMPLGDAALRSSGVSPGLSSPPSFGMKSIGNEEIRNGRDARGTMLRADASELGPAGGCGAQERGADSLIAEAEVRARIEDELGPLVPVDRATEAGVGPANVYRLSRGNPVGRIGFISAMSAPFCATCNRLRLTATGVLRSCLFEGGEVDLKPLLRDPKSGAPPGNEIGEAMTRCVALKPDVHSGHGSTQMSRIGG